MQKFPGLVGVFALSVGMASLITACDAPESIEGPADPQMLAVTGGSLLECPAGESRAAFDRILPFLGGMVAVGANRVVVPLTAILGVTDITIEVPETDWVMVDLTANGAEHYQFRTPVSVTIDYSRCSDEALAGGPLTVWNIDAEGNMLQNMGGTDNRLFKRITFTTDHFSGYAIAN